MLIPAKFDCSLWFQHHPYLVLVFVYFSFWNVIIKSSTYSIFKEPFFFFITLYNVSSSSSILSESNPIFIRVSKNFEIMNTWSWSCVCFHGISVYPAAIIASTTSVTFSFLLTWIKHRYGFPLSKIPQFLYVNWF